MADFRVLTIEGVDYTLPTASTSQSGVVQLNNTTTSSSSSQAATAQVAKTIKDALDTHIATDASTTVEGHVKLTNEITDATESTTATTPNAVMQAIADAGAGLLQHRQQAAGGDADSPAYGHVAMYVSGTTLYIVGGTAPK